MMISNGVKKIFRKIIAMPKRMVGFLVRFFLRLPKNVWNIAKKTLHLLKNPKMILSAWLLAFQRTRKFLKRLPKLSREYLFLLVMSAENNIHRLKRKNFRDLPTLNEFKTYQKQLRKKTFKIALTSVATMVVVISLPGFFQNYFAHSKTWQWVQNSWVGGASPIQLIQAGWGTNWSNYQAYFSKSGGNAITANAAGVTLSNITAQTAKEDGTTAFAYSGVSTATDQGAYATGGGASTGVVGLKKLQGATCTTKNECISNGCAGSVCCADACCGQAPVTKDAVTYNLVAGADKKCWLDRNLGATAVATIPNTQAAYGWYFQWGRGADGHQIPTSGTTTTLSSTDAPGHGNFIINNTINPYDWRSPKNDTLWQGVNGINNPCPTGFRLPTGAEWQALINAAGITNSTTAASSTLHLPTAGDRGISGDSPVGTDGTGYYWNTGTSSGYSGIVQINSNGAYVGSSLYRAYGLSVRCVQN
jgi:uncharacterized protein (TIGR02145 family)